MHNCSDKFIHLTNYAINKDNPAFVVNETCEEDQCGHKRSLTSLFTTLEEQGVDIDNLWARIHEIVIKTLVVAQPFVVDAYKSV